MDHYKLYKVRAIIAIYGNKFVTKVSPPEFVVIFSPRKLGNNPKRHQPSWDYGKHIPEDEPLLTIYS